MKGGEFNCGFLKHRRIGDGVPPIYRLSLVTGHAHRRGARRASAFEVTYSGPAKVVNEPPRDARVIARLRPCMPEVPDRRPVCMTEHPRDDAAESAFDFAHTLALGFESSAQFRREWEVAAFAVL
jgi:hypothetical protein